MTVRTRFAPSPTGFMHVGGVRTALFAWLLAKQQGGQFILRIEDTDKAREVAGSTEHIMESLNWLGVIPDESPEMGGAYGPYIQSERLDTYKPYAQKLIDKGLAYADPRTTEELDALREQAQAAKKPMLFREHRPENPPTWDGTMPLRFKVPEVKAMHWHDAARGDLSAGPEALDDFILLKSDGYPTYNFAHIIDDFEMKITHIIRGDEFIASTPKYLSLYEALEITPPIFATPPPIMGPDGKKKLGKRDGAKDVLDYRTEGYLPEAMMNFLASLGWNDGTEQEIFSVNELIAKFSLDRIQKGGARFDEQRLTWMNGQWIRKLTLDELYRRAADFWPVSAQKATDADKKRVLQLVQDRLKTLADLPTITDYFFAEPVPNFQMIADNKQLKKLSHEEITDLLRQAKAALAASTFDAESVQTTLNSLIDQTGQKPMILFSLIRLTVSWAPFSPALNETLATIGQARTLQRLDKALADLPKA